MNILFVSIGALVISQHSDNIERTHAPRIVGKFDDGAFMSVPRQVIADDVVLLQRHSLPAGAVFAFRPP